MAKPKIDLADPIVSAGIEIYKEQATRAYDLAAKNDNAVRPIFAWNARSQSVQHVGSCVLLKVDKQCFALSASHVFDNVGKYQLLIGHGDRLHSLGGDRFSSKQGASGSHRDDPIDASVFHIAADVAATMHSSFLSLEDLDVVAAARGPEFYVAAGYRVTQSRSTPKGHTTKLDRYPSLELDNDHYEYLNLSRTTHLVLAFEDQVLVDGKWQMAPSIRGLSGGAMFRIPNLSPLSSVVKPQGNEVKLAAILIEHRKGRGDRFFSSAVGIRLDIHFGLIHTYLPELKFDERLLAEHSRQIGIVA